MVRDGTIMLNICLEISKLGKQINVCNNFGCAVYLQLFFCHDLPKSDNPKENSQSKHVESKRFNHLLTKLLK